MNSEFRKLPSVDEVLRMPEVEKFAKKSSHGIGKMLVKEVIERTRLRIQNGETCPSLDKIRDEILKNFKKWERIMLSSVINGTGVILHTNLGRAPLSRRAIEKIEKVAEGYSNLEFEVETGERGSRYSHIESLLIELSGAEAGFVVNNNASAVLLSLSTLANGKEVLVSRGELIEIGGEFRLPEILKESGAKLKEVGTTNRTYIGDYEKSIGAETGAILKTHTSNYLISGFVNSVSVSELSILAKSKEIPLIVDLGSGVLIDTTRFGLAHEPTIQETVSAGASLVTFSGDKLLGGPQGGLIVGEKELIDVLKKNPLTRTVRVDKLTLAGLQETLMHYLLGEAEKEIPIWQMISGSKESLEERGMKILERVKSEISNSIEFSLVDCSSTIGGGSLPGETLKSKGISLSSNKISVEEIGRRLRHNGVIGRIEEDSLILDLRTILPHEDNRVIELITNCKF